MFVCDQGQRAAVQQHYGGARCAGGVCPVLLDIQELLQRLGDVVQGAGREWRQAGQAGVFADDDGAGQRGECVGKGGFARVAQPFDVTPGEYR
jgi:hypothetical protein